MGEDTQSNLSSKIGAHSEYIYPGNSMFSQGDNLKHSLIDVTKAYDYVNQHKEDPKKQLNNDLHTYNKTGAIDTRVVDSIDIVPSNQVALRTNQKQKWSKILEYMRKNPKALMEAIPSPRGGEKLKDFPVPNFNMLKEQLSKLPTTAMPPLPRKEHSEVCKSVTSQGNRTNKSMKRKERKSNRMVVLKPVPIPVHDSNKKRFRFEGNSTFIISI